MMITLLLIEDDPILSESLKLSLELENFKILLAKNLQEARSLYATNDISVILLDVNLPDGLGYEFCQELRDKGFTIPILMLTSQNDEESILKGFDSGANDYVKKPFGQKELIARIRVALRTSGGIAEKLTYDNLTVWPKLRKAFIANDELTLNRREFDLLKYFVESPESVITREMIIQRLNNAEEINDRTVDSHISHIRAKLRKAKFCKIKIKAEYGIGYRLTNDKE